MLELDTSQPIINATRAQVAYTEALVEQDIGKAYSRTRNSNHVLKIAGKYNMPLDNARELYFAVLHKEMTAGDSEELVIIPKKFNFLTNTTSRNG